jgi:hypothetical protein
MGGNAVTNSIERTLDQTRAWLHDREPGFPLHGCIENIKELNLSHERVAELIAEFLVDLPGNAAMAAYYVARDLRDLIGDEEAKRLALLAPTLPGNAAMAAYCVASDLRDLIGDEEAKRIALLAPTLPGDPAWTAFLVGDGPA